VQMAVEQLSTSQIVEDDKIFLEIIQRNSKRINNLIAELLDSYRPYEKKFKPTELKYILNESVQMVLDRAKLKGITVKLGCPEDDCLIQADEERLKIAFSNILVNATEAISSDNGQVEVSLALKAEHYIVEITDNGCGISPEILTKLFEPYFTSKRNGMGLGLASTLNIVQAHGGTIDVKSEVNIGSTFIITFPCLNEYLKEMPFNVNKSSVNISF